MNQLRHISIPGDESSPRFATGNADGLSGYAQRKSADSSALKEVARLDRLLDRLSKDFSANCAISSGSNCAISSSNCAISSGSKCPISGSAPASARSAASAPSASGITEDRDPVGPSVGASVGPTTGLVSVNHSGTDTACTDTACYAGPGVALKKLGTLSVMGHEQDFGISRAPSVGPSVTAYSVGPDVALKSCGTLSVLGQQVLGNPALSVGPSVTPYCAGPDVDVALQHEKDFGGVDVVRSVPHPEAQSSSQRFASGGPKVKVSPSREPAPYEAPQRIENCTIHAQTGDGLLEGSSAHWEGLVHNLGSIGY